MALHAVRRVPVVNAAGGLEELIGLDDILELLSEEQASLVKLVAREQRRERTERELGPSVRPTTP